jgi:hypothetical protein
MGPKIRQYVTRENSNLVTFFLKTKPSELDQSNDTPL